MTPVQSEAGGGPGAELGMTILSEFKRAPKKDLHLAASGNSVHLRYRPDVVDCSGYEGSHRFGVGLKGQNLCQRWPLPARGEALQDNLRIGDDYNRLAGHGWTVADITAKTGKSSASINAALDLQGAPPEVQNLVA